ncbi:hypothetical protein [Acidihalobacter prosperus]
MNGKLNANEMTKLTAVADVAAFFLEDASQLTYSNDPVLSEIAPSIETEARGIYNCLNQVIDGTSQATEARGASLKRSSQDEAPPPNDLSLSVEQSCDLLVSALRDLVKARNPMLHGYATPLLKRATRVHAVTQQVCESTSTKAPHLMGRRALMRA